MRSLKLVVFVALIVVGLVAAACAAPPAAPAAPASNYCARGASCDCRSSSDQGPGGRVARSPRLLQRRLRKTLGRAASQSS